MTSFQGKGPFRVEIPAGGDWIKKEIESKSGLHSTAALLVLPGTRAVSTRSKPSLVVASVCIASEDATMLRLYDGPMIYSFRKAR